MKIRYTDFLLEKGSPPPSNFEEQYKNIDVSLKNFWAVAAKPIKPAKPALPKVEKNKKYKFTDSNKQTYDVEVLNNVPDKSGKVQVKGNPPSSKSEVTFMAPVMNLN